LLIAGYGDADVGTATGVEVLGRVDDSTAVLERCAALVFPCPDTSGPKVKVMEAFSLGLPVVTTAAGVEGLDVDATAAVLVPQPAPAHVLADAVVSLLVDPHARAELGERGRKQLCAAHAPEVAAGIRLAAIDAALIG
jgi:glycosyltransferase involved in cell wall biosynthesis